MAEDPREQPPESETDPQQRFFGFDEDISGVAVPSELPILPLRGVVIFPSAIVPLLISRGASLKLVESCLQGDRMLGLMAQKNPEEEAPDPEGLYSRGTAGRILKMLKYPDGSVRILVQGLKRIEVTRYTQREVFLKAEVRHLQDVFVPSKDLEAIQAHMVNQFARFVSMIPYLPDELQVVVMNIKDPSKVTDLIASNLNIALEEKQDLLSTLDVRARLEKLSTILNREIELLELGHKIQSQVQSELSKNQKEFYLRQQLKAIQKELGEGDGKTAEFEELRKRIDAAQMPPEALKTAEHELERLRIIPPESAEHTVVRTYLEWLVAIPWAVATEDNLDLHHARQVLDEDHFDLEKIKERILEYLAVRQLRKNPKSPILCFVGPPGVGKTSLGKSIARAMGRKFVRLSLGGIRDEAEIRGHRRTYIGALPGRIIQNIRNAGSNNPLFMLDEIDKLGMDFRGDPAAALLEVLDPEQNNSFQDHYLGPDKFFSEVAERTEEPGVAVGLAWTPNGGDILFIESTRMAGKKNLTLTGHLGEVMKESAQAALSYVRSRATRLGIAPDFFENTDIHIHVPHGAIPKDGPSAGVTIVTSLASLLTGRHVRPNVAMTGEITLRGKVEPVGGIKEKVLAAKRAGIEMVILPRRNEKDLEDLPESVRRALRFVFVDTVDEVLEHALEPAQTERGQRAAIA